jgi:altronate hydrolase
MADSQVSFIRLHPKDNVLVSRTLIPADRDVIDPISGESIGQTTEAILPAHKVAAQNIGQGEPIIKFGEIIGFATQAIAAAEWVHIQNVGRGQINLKHDFCVEKPPLLPVTRQRSFEGFRRPDGRAGTRNYIAILSTVNCSATTAKMIARNFPHEILQDYPGVDGIVPLTHPWGCAIEYGGEDHQQLARTMAGYAQHPNVAACVVVGLGCEAAHASFLSDRHQLVSLDNTMQHGIPTIHIQDVGGVRKTVDRIVGNIKEILPDLNKLQRVTIPASELIIGTECGGSDGYSGITANPVLGYMSDIIVAQGGTSILAETPELVGGEHILTRRAASVEVAEELLARIDWWHKYLKMFGMTIDNNPSYGNKKGGITTLYEKSLGALTKGGTTTLNAVYKYAERVTKKGFVVMDTPGYDPASVTGVVAGGANVVIFTTGRGSCFGCKPVPSIKVTTNSAVYRHMPEDMDFDAGRILDGATIQQLGEELFEDVLLVASGKKTKSELQGIGDEEFCPWHPGPIT